MRRIGLISASLAVLAGLAVNLASDSVTWRFPLWVLLGIAVVGTAAAAWFARPRPARVPLDSPVEALAEAVREQWENEAGIRDLLRPDPVPVHWSTTGRPVRARGVSFRLSGSLDGIVDAFLALPRRQLVVLGGPGSGKTVLAVLFTLGLLKKRQPGEPVPVLLSLASWDPAARSLPEWLAARLAADYPGVPDPLGLVNRGTVLPVLDGLDELPESLRSRAIDGIDHAMAGGRPMVVTCRGAEYEQAVTTGGVALSGAAVIEIEPVDPMDSMTFITARAPESDRRWDVVCQHLKDAPDGSVACVLSTPLMAWLARRVYAHPSTNPAELLGFPDRAAIEEQLLSASIPAAYARHPDYTADQAHRWLSFLAGHLARSATHDVAWWRLYRVIGPVIRLWSGIAVALVVTVAGWLLGLIVTGPRLALLFAVFAIPAGFAAAVMPTELARGPARVGGYGRGLKVRLTRRFAWAFLITIAMMFAISTLLVLTGSSTLSPGQTMVRFLIFGPLVGTVVGAISAVYGWFTMPVTAVSAPSPRSALRDDRKALAVEGLAGGLAFALPMGLLSAQAGILWGLVFGLLIGITTALVVGFGRTASTRFMVVRILLALRGKLPWRLMRFLDDAHGRGILRQSGAVYQFRHALLRDHLAGAVRGG